MMIIKRVGLTEAREEAFSFVRDGLPGLNSVDKSVK